MLHLGVSTGIDSIVAATRDANRALWGIAIVRMASDPATQSSVQRRTREGLSKKEILRCLKRYIARQLYRLLLGPIRCAH
jgi:transposase